MIDAIILLIFAEDSSISRIALTISFILQLPSSVARPLSCTCSLMVIAFSAFKETCSDTLPRVDASSSTIVACLAAPSAKSLELSAI